MNDIVYVTRIKNGQCVVYNAKTGAPVRSMPGRDAVSAGVNGDLVTVTFKDGKAKVFKAATGQQIRELI